MKESKNWAALNSAEKWTGMISKEEKKKHSNDNDDDDGNDIEVSKVRRPNTINKDENRKNHNENGIVGKSNDFR